MSSGAEKRSAFQLINDHIRSLEQDVNRIDEQQKHLDKLKESAHDDIYRKYDILVSAIKESHAGTSKQLDELYEQQKRKLEEARQKLIDRKTKAETELIVDHRPVEIPEVSLNCTVNILSASLAIGLLNLSSAESGRNTFPMPKHEVKAEPGCSVGGFSFPGPSTSSDSGVCPVIASLSVPSAVPPKSNEPTRKRKKKEAAPAKTESRSRPSAPPIRKITVHTLRDFIRCTECRRPRCVYSSKKLTRDDQECWKSYKGVMPYRCGANLFPTQLLTVEPTDCSKEVHYHYFSHERKFPAVCYKCGVEISSSSSSTQMPEEEQSDMIIHDVCQSCKNCGIEPRTKKKKPASKKAKPASKKANDDKQSKKLTYYY